MREEKTVIMIEGKNGEKENMKEGRLNVREEKDLRRRMGCEQDGERWKRKL